MVIDRRSEAITPSALGAVPAVDLVAEVERLRQENRTLREQLAELSDDLDGCRGDLLHFEAKEELELLGAELLTFLEESYPDLFLDFSDQGHSQYYGVLDIPGGWSDRERAQFMMLDILSRAAQATQSKAVAELLNYSSSSQIHRLGIELQQLLDDAHSGLSQSGGGESRKVKEIRITDHGEEVVRDLGSLPLDHPLVEEAYVSEGQRRAEFYRKVSAILGIDVSSSR